MLDRNYLVHVPSFPPVAKGRMSLCGCVYERQCVIFTKETVRTCAQDDALPANSRTMCVCVCPRVVFILKALQR